MTDRPASAAPPSSVAGDETLVERARSVLDANWTGHATRPSTSLYPHQWSWDSAFIAIGYSWFDQARAETELRSLFAGQWRNGLLPNIVFVEDSSPYFPGPEMWQTERSPDAPNRPRTSGVVQPPIHATAAWQLYRRAPDRDRAEQFLRTLFPRLEAWHAYLHRDRARDDSALVEIWHPWESGLDNSPLWDQALDRIDPGDVATYRRTDNEFCDPSERPTEREYDRYIHLVKMFRDRDYDASRIRDETPFAMRDALFNALLVQADRDLARIADVVGADPVPFEEHAARVAQAINDELWTEDFGYAVVDVVADRTVVIPTVSRFTPLYAGIPTAERAGAMREAIVQAAVEVGGGGLAVPSLSPDDPGFDPTRYWRGPIWINVNWMLCRGLLRYGFGAEGRAFRTGIIELARQHGFHEHYHPLNGHGHGGAEFAWSAALVIDLINDTDINDHEEGQQ